jgi:hypothetical protein
MTTAIEVNCSTGEVIERELTDLEIEQLKADQAANIEQQADDEKLAADRAAMREAVYTKLGLTADEVDALFG